MLNKTRGVALVTALLAALAGCMTHTEPPPGLNLSLDRLTVQKKYEVVLQPVAQPLVVNKIHSWNVKLTTADGKPVPNARIAVDGGMPQHGHGLPTQPRVGAGDGNGQYLLEGMKFSMTGWWEIKLDIDSDLGRDQIVFNAVIPQAR